MLIKEKKNTRVVIELDDNEIACLNYVNAIATFFTIILEKNGKTELISSSTEEVFYIKDFFVLRELLSGLIDREDWILK